MTDPVPAIAPHNAIWHGSAVLRLREGYILLLAQHEDVCIVHYHSNDNSAPTRGPSGALGKVASFVSVETGGSAREVYLVGFGSR